MIVTDAMDRWSARTKWDFDFFRSQYGSDTVLAVGGMQSKAAKVMKLADYIDYTERPTEAARGFWIDPVSGFPLSQPLEPPTAPCTSTRGTRWRNIQSFTPTWKQVHISSRTGSHFSPNKCGGFFTGRTRRTSGCSSARRERSQALHQDFGCTHTYLAQIRGSKKCMLFSPEESAFIYHGLINPEQPDLVRFPLLERATCFEAVLEPGEMLFMPARWWHHVVASRSPLRSATAFSTRPTSGIIS